MHGQEPEKKDIISFIEFPKPDLNFGRLLNDPFFCLNIYNDKFDEAVIKQKIKDIEKGLSKYSNPQDLYELGNYYFDLSNYDKALSYYKQFLDKSDQVYDSDIKDLQKMFMLGDIYHTISRIDPSDKKTNLERSLTWLNNAAELNPDDQNLLMKLGDCYLSQNRTVEALYCYNKILKNNDLDFSIYTRLQAASFQGDYIRLINSKPKERIDNLHLFQDFDYIQTAINNSGHELKKSLTLQHYIYLLRLLLIRDDSNAKNVNLSKDEGEILNEAEELLKSINIKGIKKNNISYLSGIVNYLKKDYKHALSDIEKSLIGNRSDILKYDDILFINLFCLNNEKAVKTMAYDLIKKYPDPKYYMILAYSDMAKNETLTAEMLCTQALSLRSNYAAAYLGFSAIYAMKGNFKSADEMIRKCTFHIHDEYQLNMMLYTQMRINEAVIALLKEENERAKIILQSMISDENNDKALEIYQRCFNK
jgi:tetratricopeptide (TPR) repeat protein